ncbi:glycosyltransferase family protein [Erwinia oleae]|uniref:glycosyltransferase family 2 protein n=1 Tax=Erwinia oleae TaxID=796334 RepID=UPI000556862B|nr:glycosyltransferase family 2 protein [Erwinia oleae]
MIFISIVSHGHYSLIKKLGTLLKLAQNFPVIVTDNVGESELENYCLRHKLHYIKNSKKKGFGENNNQNYRYAKDILNLQPDDLFLVLNPDVSVTAEILIDAMNEMKVYSANIATIDLVKKETERDANIRNFPTIKHFIESFLLNKNETIIDKSKIKEPCLVDWASGSFLLIKSSLYDKVDGFDEKFFMYCEDLDICRRIYSLTNQRVLYIPGIEALHLAAHNNRNILSKHFLWHIKSVFRYCFFAKY